MRLTWNDLTDLEKEQATESYLFIRTEEDPSTKPNPEFVKCCTFERQEDGYIFVNI